MKAGQIASFAVHEAIAMVPEQPQILARVVSQLRSEFGHGVSWKTGAAYVTLRDWTTVAVPRRRLNAALRKYGQFVRSVR